MVKERVILGEGCTYSVDCNETGLNNNIIVCGGTGSGKTFSITEPRLLETKTSSLVATVSKRRIVSQYTPLFEQRGYDVLDLNFANPKMGNCSYNPLDYIKDSSDIRFLAQSIIKADHKNNNSTADPYWDEAAVDLLSAEIAFVLMTNANPTFKDVISLHQKLSIDGDNGLIHTTLDDKFEFLASKEPNCFAVNCWKSFKNLPIKTAGCIYGTLNSALNMMFTPELLEAMSEKESIDFENLAKKKFVLWVTTSAVNPAVHLFVNLFYAQAFKEFFEYAERCADSILPIPIHVLCDDFAVGGRIENFENVISVFREKRLSVTLLLQSESQLEQMYGSYNATTIINNCDTYIYLGGMDIKTAQHISMRINAPLDEVLYMPIGDEIVIRRGSRPVITKRYNIKRNKVYQELCRAYENKIKYVNINHADEKEGVA